MSAPTQSASTWDVASIFTPPKHQWHQTLKAVHSRLKADDEEPSDYQQVGGKDFDRYDMATFLYGMIFALQDKPDLDNPVSSNCFLSVFEMVTQLDYLATDLLNIFATRRFYDVFVYTPSHIAGNLAASYEYCNMYVYLVQAAMLASFDYGYLSELTTRYSLLFSTELSPYLTDVMNLLGEENVDWYALGFRTGIIWKLAFDVKISA